MKFHLLGAMYWTSSRDIRGLTIDNQFEAPNKEQAVEVAKVIIRKLNKQNFHRANYGFRAELSVIKPIWSIQFADKRLKIKPNPKNYLVLTGETSEKKKKALRPEDFVKEPSTERLKEISHNIKIDALVNGTYYNKEGRR